MRFSIIIPAHNTDKWISKCLESIRQQTFKDYQLIVLCDACTDNTEQIARGYADIVEVVDYHADGLTRNRGLEIATGEYIVFVDSDDWLLHEYVLDQLNTKIITENYPDVIAFSFIMDVWTVLWYSAGFDLELYKASIIAAIPHTILYAVSNFIFLLVLAKPFGDKLERIKIKYGV